MADGSSETVVPSPDFISRVEHSSKRPVEGDYFVVYSNDNYESWSPKGAFEDGYTRT